MPLREVLAEQPVHVLVRGPLPGRVRVAEVHLDIGVQLQPDLCCFEHLVAIPKAGAIQVEPYRSETSEPLSRELATRLTAQDGR